MSLKVTSWIWENSKAKGNKLLALLALADWCDDFGVCYPGVTRIASKGRVSKRSMQSTLQALEESGFVVVETANGVRTGSGNFTNRYYLKNYRDAIGMETPKGRGVKSTTPHGVIQTTPNGVKSTAPKPLVEQSEEQSEKDIPANAGQDKSSVGQGGTTDNETEPGTTTQRTYKRHESGYTIGTKTIDPFEDKNLPDAKKTPLVPDDKLPERTGTRFNMDGTKTPIHKGDRTNNRIVTIRKDDIETQPAQTQTDIVEDEKIMPSPESETKKEKPKTERQLMMDAILNAVGWQESDVTHWGRIQKTATALLKKAIDPGTLDEWRIWNAQRQCGKIENPEGITSSWPKFMAHKRTKPTIRKAQELSIQVDEEYL